MSPSTWLDDSVERYVESWPYGASVTVRQIISHTSGIPKLIPLRWVQSVARQASFDENDALAAVLHDHPRLSFEPGTKYAYSNIGYWLLGKVVERVSGETFSAYVSGHILRPLAIAPQELGYVVADPAHHATGYLEKYSLMNLAKGLDRANWLLLAREARCRELAGTILGTFHGQSISSTPSPRTPTHARGE